MFLKISAQSILAHFNLLRFCVSTSLLLQAYTEVEKALEVQVTLVAYAD